MSKAEIERAIIWVKERIEYIAQNCDLKDEDNKRALECLEIANKSLLERQELAKEIDKQSKIIDEMAMEIASYDNDETFCKEVYPNNSCEGNGIPCWDCVKQYFEKKVEEK